MAAGFAIVRASQSPSVRASSPTVCAQIARRMGLRRGKILDFPETCYRRVRALSFSAPGMRVNVDGEIIPEARAEIRLLPEALWICR